MRTAALLCRGARIAAAGAAVAAYHLVARPRFEHYGAAADDLAATYPEQDLIPGSRRGATMAAAIAAPPADVWPWLVQMGCDRAGWYSWDRLDNGGRPSSERIHPEWQQLRVGDRLASVPDGSRWFEVAALEPERTLVLRASLTLIPAGHCFDPGGPRPKAFVDSTWGFHLQPAGTGTRLVTTGWSQTHPRMLGELADWLVWDPAHWIMQIKQFNEIRRRAERAQ